MATYNSSTSKHLSGQRTNLKMGMKPHILAIPYPAQGHVIPLLELMQWLSKQGFKVTFVNTEFNHTRVLNSLSNKQTSTYSTSSVVVDDDNVHLVSIPDGLEPWEDRNDFKKLIEAISQVMPGKLEELIKKINNGSNEDEKINCVIADENIGWALDVAEKMGIRRAAFWPAAAAVLALEFSIPELLGDGIINNNGTPIQNQMIQLSPTMPAIHASKLVWACIGDLATDKAAFEMVSRNKKSVKVANGLICNSAFELESAAFSLFPDILPIGPLLSMNHHGKSAGSFWEEDSTCLEWLDQHPPDSVIYVAFGSFTVFDYNQFQELALGLELTNRPFLWVVRPDPDPDHDHAFPDGFRDRVGNRGQIVGWAPQQQVLSHPSVACFLSHCGWNSTMEGVSNGVPFLCWPHFADQFFNQAYICDVWKVGLGFNNGDESGIIKRGLIKDKVEQLFGDKAFNKRALDLKEVMAKSVREGGCSHSNLNNFIEWMKAL